MKGKNINLRALEPHDVDLLFQWENDEAVWHLSHTLMPFSRFDIDQYVMNADKDIFSSRQVRLMIDKNEESSTVGAIDLFDFDPLHKRLGLGILIATQEQRKGYASEALDLVIAYCFRKLMVHQLYVNIIPENEKSIQLFKSKDFEFIGRKRDWLLIDNQWTDELLFQLINPFQPS